MSTIFLKTSQRGFVKYFTRKERNNVEINYLVYIISVKLLGEKKNEKNLSAMLYSTNGFSNSSFSSKINL